MFDHSFNYFNSTMSKMNAAFNEGKCLSHPPKGEEICITGISGKFPDSHNVEHFKENLYNKVDMLSEDDRRWNLIHPEIPKKNGKVFDIDKFDPGFFGIHYTQTEAMDCMSRMMLEKAIETIFDAGLNPTDLEGTNTGVFLGMCTSESHIALFHEMLLPHYHVFTGAAKLIIPNRISYFLKLQGPSVSCDTACSSSMYALEHAFRAIRNGECDRALVGGVNICLHPFLTLQFSRLGVLSPDGNCKVFDEKANGYARSEACVMILLEKSKIAKRIYGRVVHAKCNNDGFKTQSITYPCAEMQAQLMKEVYEECEIAPESLVYLEAHGTGTEAGDPQELQAIDEVFCKNRPDPLLVGSVKSNIGHSEPPSGLASIAKVIISTENDLIAPNINLTTLRKDCEAFEKHRLIVVTEKTPLRDDVPRFIGVNSFGFGGANAHVLLDCTSKRKDQEKILDNLPRIVCVCGRIEEGVRIILDDLKSKPYDPEYIALYHNIFRKNVPGSMYRGYSILSKTKGELFRSIEPCYEEISPLNIVLSDFGDYWSIIARDLVEVPTFNSTLENIHQILSKVNINMSEILENRGSNSHLIFNKVMGTGIVQIGFVNIFKAIKVKPDTIFGSGIADFISGYYIDSLTLEETVLSIYHLARFAEKLVELKTPPNGDKITNTKTETLNTIKSQLLSDLKKNVSGPIKRGPHWAAPNKPTEFSAENFVSSLNSDATDNYLNNINRNGILAEIGLGQIIEISPKVENVLSMKKIKTEDSFSCLLKFLGSLYQLGIDMDLASLYPEIQWPVSRGTPNISSLIRWHHERSWFIPDYSGKKVTNKSDKLEKVFRIELCEKEWNFMEGHLIDGRCLLPATGYLMLVWETFADYSSRNFYDLPVIFENCRFLQALNLSPNHRSIVTVSLSETGSFTVTETGETLVEGTIRLGKGADEDQVLLPKLPKPNNTILMNTKDIYKELRLRHYNYKGLFRSIKSSNVDGTYGKIAWHDNWVAFMDNMLQMRILQFDTRSLFVPTSIEQLSIDPRKHQAKISSLGDNPELSVYCYPENGIIKSDGIEIRGLQAASISTRKSKADPVLETYQFIPNTTELSVEESLRTNMQIILENLPALKIKVTEFHDVSQEKEVLAPIIQQVLGDMPMITSNITVFSKNVNLQLPNINVLNKNLEVDHENHLVVGVNLLQNPQTISTIWNGLKPGGFIISRESNKTIPENNFGIEILTQHFLPQEVLVMFKKSTDVTTPYKIVDVSSNFEFEWLPKLQEALQKSDNVLVISQNQQFSGILGLVNCIRREPNGRDVRCFFMVDEAPKFDLNNAFYQKQLQKNLAINVFKDNNWGTYRHLLLNEDLKVESQHCFVNYAVRSDLSSLKWFEGPLTADTKLPVESELVHIYYAGLNFRDIMVASGKLNLDVITKSRIAAEYCQGIEFSGRTSNGTRVMGISVGGSMSTLFDADFSFIEPIPDDWSLEDAATTPCVYLTVIRGLITKGKIKPKESILIHAGTGGIGIAAITIALYYGCKVFTTVSTEEKRNFIKKLFPQLKDNQIGNSRDTSFEQMVKIQTNGQGVDLVLSSLAGDKLFASARCLARGGRFLEIGKYDLANNNKLSLLLLEKEASYHGIMADGFFDACPAAKRDFLGVLRECIKAKMVKPLPRTIFKTDEIEKAYRFMATGKHMGKILVEIKKEEKQKIVTPVVEKRLCTPRYMCDPEKVYIVIGGLGGFGLELIDWLVIRGAKKVWITSRNGVTTGYQAYRLKIWKSYCVEIKISTHDITSKESCEQLLKDAANIGKIHSIFNLAVVLRDCLLENQSVETFIESFQPKAFATMHLDELTRKYYPDLRDFVVFSSVSCGRGNAGQTNYGMANSIMERICEKRRADGYSGIAIEWGAVGDVGLVADMQEEHVEIEIGGTLQQKISNCIQVLDVLLRQSAPVVASMVVAEKRGGAGGSENVIDVIAHIIGLRDKKVVSKFATLPELGMDSMSAVEIKQTLERDFDIFLTPNDLRNLTFAKLEEIQEEKMIDDSKDNIPNTVNILNLVFDFVEDEEIANKPIVQMKSKLEAANNNERKIFILPGIEGIGKLLNPLAAQLDAEVYCLQYCPNFLITNIREHSAILADHIKKNIQKEESFHIIAYSFGGILGLEVINLLEKEGYKGKVIYLDSTPLLMELHFKANIDVTRVSTDLLLHIMTMFLPPKVVEERRPKIMECKTFEDQFKIGCSSFDDLPFKSTYIHQLVKATVSRMQAFADYKAENIKISSEMKLFKPSIATVTGLEEDSSLQEFCEKPVEVKIFNGDHVTFIQNQELAVAINKWVATDLF